MLQRVKSPPADVVRERKRERMMLQMARNEAARERQEKTRVSVELADIKKERDSLRAELEKRASA